MKKLFSLLLTLFLATTFTVPVQGAKLNELVVAPEKGISDTINYVNQLNHKSHNHCLIFFIFYFH